MKPIQHYIKKIILLLFLALLVFPYLQSRTEFVDMKPLQGALETPANTGFSITAWLSGDYQLKKEKWLNETFGFRTFFIRLNNQIEFSLFHKARAKGVVIGKEGFLFEEGYINAYYGKDFSGKAKIDTLMHRLRFIQDTLSGMNKTFVLVFAAGKGSYYPEYFPSSYKTTRGITNYRYSVESAKNYGINVIDFNRFFLQHKESSPYPLFPKYGTHWSHYGACLVTDSLVRYIEKQRDIDMPGLKWKAIQWKKAMDTDFDVAAGMNLLFEPEAPMMAYPDVTIEPDSAKVKPSILVIADSYYSVLYAYFPRSFSTDHFWFYNKQVFPESQTRPLFTDQLILDDEIDKHDVIMMMITEANLSSLGWGFPEQAYELFHNPSAAKQKESVRNTKRLELMAQIRKDKAWMDLIRKKAKKNNISVDSMLFLDADWMIQQGAN